MAMVLNVQGPDGIICDFETTASHLFPHYSVAKRKPSGDKRNHFNVSEMLSQLEVTSSSVVPNPSIEKT